DKLKFARKRNIPVDEPTDARFKIDRNLWGASLYVTDLADAWQAPPAEVYVMTNPVEQAPNEPRLLTVGFTAGVPTSLEGQSLDLLPLVRELNRLGGEHGIGRSDVVEDRLFGIKSREFYEAPTPTILWTAHRDLQSLVQSRETIQLRELLGRRYAELVYMGLWFSDLRQALNGFFLETQRRVTGE